MQIIASLVSLILAVNPLSGLPFVLASTGKADPHHSAALRRIGITVAIGTLFAALFGFRLLSVFGVSPMAFQAGAGFLLIVTGAQKFITLKVSNVAAASPAHRAHRRLRRTRRIAAPQSNLSLLASAVSPVGVPILVGPAALAVCAVNGVQYGDALGIFINAGLSIVTGLVVFAFYAAASNIRAWLDKWQHPLSCIIGLILLCRGIDIVAHALALTV